MTNLWQDLRYGTRMLLKKPGFILTSVLILELGMGANRESVFVSATAQQMLDGDWTGEIKIGKETISINVHFKRGSDGDTGSVEMMGQKDLALANIKLQANRLQFELPRESCPFGAEDTVGEFQNQRYQHLGGYRLHHAGECRSPRFLTTYPGKPI